MNANNTYSNPLTDRYSSPQMSAIFGEQNSARLWRKLWIALAKSQKELGLDIKQNQIDELEKNLDNINFEDIAKFEKQTRHDVMAHIKAYAVVAPNAAPIIHLGATSNFVKDNGDILTYVQALKLTKSKLLIAVQALSKFAIQHKDLPTLGWTHLQPAQLTTVGKRAALWAYDFVNDIEQIDFVLQTLRLRGVKGTTGTQASFLELFEGNHELVKKLDKLVAKKFDFDDVYHITGQTYSRKVDYNVLSVLSSVCQSAAKFATDIRLLMSIKEVEEPFEKDQVGSSAMAYKRNPMRCERICGLARFVISLPINASMTASTQWFERTLDDSANRRITMSQAFLAVDGILNLLVNVSSNLVVYPNVIAKNIRAELPFMATENIIMQGVKAGGDRQKLHEAIRTHSMQTSKRIKEEGLDNNLIDSLKNAPEFANISHTFDDILDPKKYTGRASQQVQEFVNDVVNPLLQANSSMLDSSQKFEIKV